ncbi:hypothetical protein U1Q18_043346, partial [Sarracenia purpurea var. burkii]
MKVKGGRRAHDDWDKGEQGTMRDQWTISNQVQFRRPGGRTHGANAGYEETRRRDCSVRTKKTRHDVGKDDDDRT